MAIEAVSRVLALGAYDGVLRQVVRLLKFRDRQDLAGFLGRQLALLARTAEPTAGQLDGVWRFSATGQGAEVGHPRAVWVPVPSHRRRVRQRGYDHVRLLTRAAARAARAPWMPVLARRVETPPLYRLSRPEREAALVGAFVATRPAPERVLLVDDLLTTGATAIAAAKALKAAGTQEITLIVIARA